MSTQTLAPSGSMELVHGRRGILVALGLGLLALGLLFTQEITAATQVWSESTAYNHCFMILPIALFLAWERRARLAVTPIQPMPIIALLALPIGFAWLAAERVGIMEGRQLALMTLVEILFVATLGWRFCKAFAAPLVYLYFLVPFGAFITPKLQDFTARFTAIGLDLLNIPNYTDGYTIQIPEGTFYVAEACAGLRFLIASIAFGTLYAFLIYRSSWRRIAFIGVSIIVPIIANGFRALGIVALGHQLGSAQAAATDHILYGWIFFSLVILLLTLAGLPFRQDRGPIPLGSPTLPRSRSPKIDPRLAPTVAVLAVLALGLAGPSTAGLLDNRSANVPLSIPSGAMADAGCSAAPDPSAEQTLAYRNTDFPGVLRRYLCDDGRIALQVVVLSPMASPSLVVEAERRITSSLQTDEADMHWVSLPNASDGQWLLTEAEDSDHAIASALWINGKPARTDLAGRIAQARNSLGGGSYAPVLMAISLQSDPAGPTRRGAGQALTAYLDRSAAALAGRAETLSVSK